MKLELENVKLRQIEINDTQNIVKWRNSPNVKKNFCIQQDMTEEMHMDWFKNKIQTGQVVQFIIIDTTYDKPLGSVYLRDIDKQNKKAEFGIFIGEDEARGKGIGTKSTKLILQYGFCELGLHKIYLRVFSNNLQAIKAYEKAGFIYSGTAKDDILLPNGKYQDIIFMSIINKEGM